MAIKDTLVILLPGFARDETDTTCLPFQQAFVNYLHQKYPDVNLQLLAFQYPFEAGEYTFRSVPVISFGGKNKGGIARLLLRRKIIKKLDAIHTATPIKAILSFWLGECAYVGNAFAQKQSIPHYCWLMGQDAKATNNYVRKIKPSAAQLIALSAFLADEFEKNHHIRPHTVIPPGIDSTVLTISPAIRDIDLLAVGSLIPLKQYHIFIQLVNEIKKTSPQVSAVIIGSGPEKEKLEHLIEKYGLQSTIRLTGELPHQTVFEYMQRTKIFIHPSAYEGFGMVCAEALYAGASVISFVNPMKEEVPGWINVATPEEMITTTRQLLQQKETYTSSFPFSMADSVKSIMALLGF